MSCVFMVCLISNITSGWMIFGCTFQSYIKIYLNYLETIWELFAVFPHKWSFSFSLHPADDYISMYIFIFIIFLFDEYGGKREYYFLHSVFCVYDDDSGDDYLHISSPIETPSAARFLFKLGEVSTKPLPPLSHWK